MLFPDCGAGPSCDNPTPGGAAFDDALQLWTNRTRSSPVRKRLRAPLGSGASLSRRFQPRTEPTIRPLTPLVALPECPFLRSLPRAPKPLLPPSRQRGRFPRSKAPSVDKCSLWQRLDRAVTPSQPSVTAFAGEPVTVPSALPLWFGFRRFFTPRSCLRIVKELDPLLCLRAIHP